MDSFKFEYLTQEEKEKQLDIIKNFSLENHEVFLIYGTLLGCVRNQDVIPHDTDFDLGYLSKFHTKEEVKKEMLEIYKDLHKKGILYKYFSLGYTDVFDFENMVYGCGQAHILIDELCFDLFTVWIDEDGNLNTYDYYNMSKGNLHFPLIKGNICSYEFNIFNNAEKFLIEVYGEDWKIPKDEKSKRPGRTIVLRGE